MNTDFTNRATDLANRPYFIKVALDETTDGQPVYIAHVIELEGCFGQGATVDQAITDLREAMVDFIKSLLEDGLPVPSPAELVRTTSTSLSTTFVLPGIGEKMRKEEPSHHYSNLYVSS